MLEQRSRPQLFSNGLPPTVACSAPGARSRFSASEPDLVARVRRNSEALPRRPARRGLEPLDGESAIVPIIVGETSVAIEASRRLLDRGVYVTGFGYPVVPEGSARIRIQASAALGEAEIDTAVDAVAAVAAELGSLA